MDNWKSSYDVHLQRRLIFTQDDQSDEHPRISLNDYYERLHSRWPYTRRVISGGPPLEDHRDGIPFVIKFILWTLSQNRTFVCSRIYQHWRGPSKDSVGWLVGRLVLTVVGAHCWAGDGRCCREQPAFSSFTLLRHLHELLLFVDWSWFNTTSSLSYGAIGCVLSIMVTTKIWFRHKSPLI